MEGSEEEIEEDKNLFKVNNLYIELFDVLGTMVTEEMTINQQAMFIIGQQMPYIAESINNRRKLNKHLAEINETLELVKSLVGEIKE